jgi:putative ABC transport system permease protein
VLLALLAAAVAAASVSAAVVTDRATRRAYRGLFERVSGPGALEIVGAGQGGFDPACAAALAGLSGVKAVVPRVEAMAALAGPPAADPVLVVGVADGRPAADDEILLEAGCIRERGLRPGDRVSLWTPNGLAELRLAGEVGGGPPAGVRTAAVSLRAAQRMFRLPGRVSSLQIVLRGGADANAVRAAAAPRLPPGLILQHPGARAELADATLAAVRRGLDCLGAAVLLAAVFVVHKTFRLSAVERRREFAVLRSLGMARRQVIGLMLTEAFVLGAAGAVLGAAAGPLLAAVLVRAVCGLDGDPAVHGWAAWMPALLVGPAAAVASALHPAWACSRSDLLTELRAPQGGHENAARLAPALGLLMLAGAGGLCFFACRAALPAAAARTLLAPTVGAFLAGGVLAAPLLGPLFGPAGQMFGHLLGVEWVLAARQLARRPSRTGLTVGVLFIGAAVAVGFGHWLRASLSDLRHWYARAIVADYLVRAAAADAAFVTAAPLPDGLAGEIGALDGVADVDRIAFVPARVNGRPVLVLARTFAAGRPLPLDLRDGEPDAVRRGLLNGEAVVGAGLGRTLGVGRGGQLTLETPDGQQAVRVAGTAAEYAAGGQALYLEWGAARRMLGVAGPHILLVTARPGGPSPAAGLRSFCDDRHLVLQSNADLRGDIGRLLDRVAGALWVLVAVVFLVAGFGVANTLALNVHEQRREVALLRAVGLRRGQVRGVVVGQALLLAVAALAPGTAAGLCLAWLLGARANPAAAPVQFRFEAGLTAACWAAGLTVSALAAVGAAGPLLRLETAAVVARR